MGFLSPQECAELASLHGRCLPDSQVSRLGPAYARAFYRYVSRSPHEFVGVCREEGRVAGGCVLSLEPETLVRRLAWHTPLLPWALLRASPLEEIRNWLNRRPRGQGSRDDAFPAGTPELLLIYTDPPLRGRGLGAALLARCEKFAAAHGRRRYGARTEDSPDNAALRFYAKHGFAPCGKSFRHGHAFQLFIKDVPASIHGAAPSA
ncbi:MAG: GNAT family N-acetyltransferase [Candidatus Sumerlaeota bacterium]|nr:GNAT family N-acetyltransferase [Candidatus Sumerlaeota bacterium]